MRILLKLSLVIAAFFMISCDSKDKEIEKLKSETMEIHDEVMPKMDDIMKLKKSLRAKQDSASSEDSMNIKGLILSLEKSDKVMMNWMRNYDPRMADMSEDEKVAYLKQQKISIKEVSEQMKSSISEAEDYLSQ